VHRVRVGRGWHAGKTYIKVAGRWCYVDRAIDSSGARGRAVQRASRYGGGKGVLRSAKAVTGTTPDRVTTDGRDSYLRAIRTELGKPMRHRPSCYLNKGLEQDHRGLKAPDRRPGSVEGTTNSETIPDFALAVTSPSPPSAAACSSSARPSPCWASWRQPDQHCRRFKRTGHTCWHER